MGGVISFPQPSETQKLFLGERHKYVAFGGARGGGKSWSVRVKAVLLALRYPGITIVIIRRTYPELEMNHILPLQKMLPEGVYKYNDSKKRMTFPNGSTIFFRYCDGDSDLPHFQGHEYDVMFIDEATQITEHQYQVLKACVRGTNGFPKRIYLTCNPGGVGHGWVKRLFIDRKFEGAERPEEHSFIQSRVYDNLALLRHDPDYVNQLESLSHKYRRAWLEGDWNIFEGAFFEEFRDDPRHYKDGKNSHVIDPFDIPKSWKIYRSFDWGYAKPFSCGWWAVDEDDVAYRILELYGCSGDPDEGVKWDPDQVFKKIREIETTHRWLKGKSIYGVADPAIWASDTGESIEEAAARHYVFFSKGDNSRLNGWMQVHRRLTFDPEGRAKLYVFKNCKAFIRTIPSLVYDDYQVEDLDTTQEDHVADETRYFCMSRPVGPAIPEEPDEFATSPVALALDISREDLSPRPTREKMTIKYE